MALSRAVSEVFSVENDVTLKSTSDSNSMSLKMVPFDRLCMMSYEFTTVTLSLRHTIFEIFDFKNAVTLKTGLGARQCHWKCHHSIECIRIPIDVL